MHWTEQNWAHTYKLNMTTQYFLIRRSHLFQFTLTVFIKGVFTRWKSLQSQCSVVFRRVQGSFRWLWLHSDKSEEHNECSSQSQCKDAETRFHFGQRGSRNIRNSCRTVRRPSPLWCWKCGTFQPSPASVSQQPISVKILPTSLKFSSVSGTSTNDTVPKIMTNRS